MAMMMTINK